MNATGMEVPPATALLDQEKKTVEALPSPLAVMLISCSSAAKQEQASCQL